MEQNGSDLILNPDAYRTKTDSYTSLTDLYGINLFTNKFKQRKNTVLEKNKQTLEEVKNQVFLSEKELGADIYEETKALMFTGTKTQILKEDVSQKKQERGIAYPILGVMSIIFLLFLMNYYKRKRKRSKQDVDNLDYLHEGEKTEQGYSGQLPAENL